MDSPKKFLVIFLIALGFMVVPAYSASNQVNVLKNAWFYYTDMSRAVGLIDIGGGGGIAHYATSLTPIKYSEIKKVRIYAITFTTLGPIHPTTFVQVWLYDEATSMPIYEGTYPLPVELAIYWGLPLYGVHEINSAPSPFDPNSYIYLEYLTTVFEFSAYTNLEVHTFEGLEATFNTFLTELKGNITSKPRYFHFSGHGGITNGIPYIVVRDDKNPSNYKNIIPLHIYSHLKKNDLENHTELVFLASCYSLANRYSLKYSDNFVRPIIVRGGARALIGFTGKVNSLVAYLFALKFYERLLKDRSHILDAYEEAKNDVRFWASIIGALINIVGGILRSKLKLPKAASIITAIVLIAIAMYTVWDVSQNLSRIKIVLAGWVS